MQRQTPTYTLDESSAGQATQHFDPIVATPSAPPRNRHNLIGLALVAVGVLFAFTRFVPDRGAFTAGMILLTIASGFLFFAFWRRIYPLLIPGCILVGLSIGIPFAEVSNGISIVWGLALAFVSIGLLGRALFNVRTMWPVFPALALFAVGLIIAIASLPTIFAGSLMILPIGLILAGLFLGFGRRP